MARAQTHPLERRQSLAQFALLAPAFVMLAVFFFYPLATMMKISLFNPSFSLDAFKTIYNSSVYWTVFLFTVKISAIVVIVCAALGYLVAALMANASPMMLRLLLIAIIVPYFTSMVVRAYAFIIILGQKGIVNQSLIALSIIDKPLQIMYTETAVVIGTSYILLPYMVLTIYANLKTINPSVMNAAYSLGGSRLYSFFRIYLPLSAPGLIGGSILVFLLSLGFFVTPSLMGGRSGRMIGVFIQNEIELNVNWTMASALSLVLLAETLLIVFVYSRFVNLGKILQGGT